MDFDVGLDPATRDLPVVSRLISGLDLIRQRIRVRLGTHEGEVLTDATKGMPWAAWFETKEPPVSAILARVRREIEAVPGVIRVEDLAATFTASSRSVAITGNVRTLEGDLDVCIGATGPGNFSFTAAVRTSGALAP